MLIGWSKVKVEGENKRTKEKQQAADDTCRKVKQHTDSGFYRDTVEIK